MSVTTQRRVAYGFSDPLINNPPQPIVVLRDPSAADRAQIGTIWVNKSTSKSFVLTSIINNLSTWQGVGPNAGGDFNALVVSPDGAIIEGDTFINVGTANITAIAGGTGTLILGNTTGNTAITGNVTIGTGNLVISTATRGITLPGPTRIINGAGAPAGGLSVNVGDVYINTTAATAATRMYIATAPGAWTNVTCAA